jgi:DNA-binding NtrC family response regulator
MSEMNCKLLDPPAEPGRCAEGAGAVRDVSERPGVLVVDDEHMVLVMLQMGLERSGFEVWSARSGREAVELYREHRDSIAVVLLDVRMPGLDGPQTLDALRELDPEVLACFMSGDLGGHGPEELRQRGAVCVIDKPFRLDRLARILRDVLERVPVELQPPVGVSRG